MRIRSGEKTGGGFPTAAGVLDEKSRNYRCSVLLSAFFVLFKFQIIAAFLQNKLNFTI